MNAEEQRQALLHIATLLDLITACRSGQTPVNLGGSEGEKAAIAWAVKWLELGVGGGEHEQYRNRYLYSNKLTPLYKVHDRVVWHRLTGEVAGVVRSYGGAGYQCYVIFDNQRLHDSTQPIDEEQLQRSL